MKATTWQGLMAVRVQDVPEPKIINPQDAIIRITSTAICGSDLHLYHGFVPFMEKGDVLGHEFMGQVVEVGADVRNVNVGDRVVNAFPVSCGACFQCEREMYSLCENSNPNAWMAEKLWGYSPAGIYGYSHALGGYAGGQAEYARVSFADVGLLKVPDSLTDEQVLFLSDIFPTGYMAAEQCQIQEGDIVAVWGCGPVGQHTIASAKLLGAAKVLAIDCLAYRLRMAREKAGADETIDFERENVGERLKELTGGRGPDACVDAVGMEAHAPGIDGLYDTVKHLAKLQMDRPTALRQAALACRPGGQLSVPGVFGGYSDKVPLGAIMNKSLTVRTGQTHVQHYMQPLLERIERGEADPSFIITHTLPLQEAPKGYDIFRNREDECVKVVLKP